VTGQPIKPSIEARLTTAGLPPLPRSAWLELDLDALTANLATLRVLAGPGVPIRPVVKADAYGHGAGPIAAALEAAGADGLCVATIDEGLELRQAGIGLPILVLYPVPGTWLDVAREQAIDITAGDAVLLERLLAAPGDAQLGVQLEVETGLGRGGFPLEDVAGVAARLAERSSIRITGLWTHLQAPEDRPRTERQMERFDAAIEAIAAAGVMLPARHVAASGSLLGEAVAVYDGARPGLSIYGIVPDPLVGGDGTASTARTDLQPVLSLHARPVRVVDLPAGWGISYGPSFTTERPSRIATLPIGYGDGWARSLSNRAEALVRGRRVPVVGTVAMDAIMVDVTDVPGPPVGVDDLFTLIGAQGSQRIGAHDLARTRTTISWEIVTAMSRRLPRVYHSAAGHLSVRYLAQRSG
jgi:alanine racemase